MVKQRHIIYACAVLMDFGVAAILFAVTRRAAELHATGMQLGWLWAMWSLVYAVAALFTGRWSDRVGRRRFAACGTAAAAILILACKFTTNVPLLLVLTGGFGASLSAFWPPIMGWLSEGAPDSATLNARLSKFCISWTTGLLSGFAATGFVYQHWPGLAFWIPTGAMLLILTLLALPVQPDQAGAESAGHTANPIVIQKGRGFRKTAWLANFAVTLAFCGVVALFPQLATARGISADVHGSILALGRGAGLGAFLVLPHLRFWHTRLWPLWLAQLLAVAGAIAIGLGNSTWVFAVGFTAIGFVAGYTYLASLYFTMEELTEKGKGGGFHEAVLGAGMFLGPVAAGWVGEHYSLRAPYYFCAAALAALIVAQMVLVSWRRHSLAANQVPLSSR